MPTGQPWQKDDRDVSPAEDRYLMTVIAIASNPRFPVSRVDVDRSKITYTVDTLRDLRTSTPTRSSTSSRVPTHSRAAVVGRTGRSCSRWRKFVGVSRPGYELHTEHLSSHLERLPRDAVTLIEIPALAISSTECRLRASEHRPVWYLVPDVVVQYISKRNLYRPHGGGAAGRGGHDVGAGPGATPAADPSQSSVQAEPGEH